MSLSDNVTEFEVRCLPARVTGLKDVSSFQYQVREAPVSGNIDAPEGGLDAVMQAIVCDVGSLPLSADMYHGFSLVECDRLEKRFAKAHCLLHRCWLSLRRRRTSTSQTSL